MVVEEVKYLFQPITIGDVEISNRIMMAPMNTRFRYDGFVTDKLVDYSMKQNAIFKDLSLVQNAIILLDKNEIQKAHTELRKVSQSSPLKTIVLALLHFGVK